MIRVLHIVGGDMGRGGQETFIMNLYRSINRELIQFDFIVHTQERGDYEDEIEKLGGKIFRVTRKEESIVKNFFEIIKIVNDNKFKIVQRHTDNSLVFLDLLASKWGGAKMLIAHSHSSNASHKMIHKIFRPLLNCVATDRYACSNEAGKWMYGEANFKIINNGINSFDYVYHPQINKQARKELNLENKYVIGHVGRFSKVKNHLFLIDIFDKVHQNMPNAILLLIGDGEMRKAIEARIKELQLQYSVKLLGIRTDIPRLLQCMDIFLFPSLYEGLPVSLIEAQATGLPCIISDNITDDIEITDLIVRCSINEDPEYWANTVFQHKETYNRDLYTKKIIDSGFDINITMRKIQQYYIDGLKE